MFSCIRNIFKYHLLMALSLHVDLGVESFYLNSVVHGRHIYKDIWSSDMARSFTVSAKFVTFMICSYAVSVIKHETGIAGHLPK